MAVNDDPPPPGPFGGYFEHLDRVDRLDTLLLQLLYHASTASALAASDLARPGALDRVRDNGRKLHALAPLLVHLVTYGRQHLAELAEAMADDPRAAHLFEVSTTSPSEGLPPSAKH